MVINKCKLYRVMDWTYQLSNRAGLVDSVILICFHHVIKIFRIELEHFIMCFCLPEYIIVYCLSILDCTVIPPTKLYKNNCTSTYIEPCLVINKICDVQKEIAYYFCKEDRTAGKMLSSTKRLSIWIMTRKYKNVKQEFLQWWNCKWATCIPRYNLSFLKNIFSFVKYSTM